MAKKFIINNGTFIMSACVEFHRELAKDHTTTKGGGWWEIVGNTLYLYGKSFDFGQAKIEDIISAFKEGWVSARMEKFEIWHSTDETYVDMLIGKGGTKIKEANKDIDGNEIEKL